MSGTDGSHSRLRVGGWVPESRRERRPADEDLFRSVDLGTGVTQEYGGEAYGPGHRDGHAPDQDPGWSQPADWTEPPDFDDAPTTTWTRPEKWTDPGEPWSGDANKGRGRWRNAQMLFRRRYNTAAVVTLSAVAAVLVLLATIPMEGQSQATNVMPGASTGHNQMVQFQAITFEAESAGNTLIGSANVGPYTGASGGQLVRAIGNWGSARGLGALRFNNVVVPKNNFYVLTFYFVNIRAKATRTAIITASGSPSKSVTVASTPSCCTPQKLLIFLFKGKNSITFSNPTGEAPAIDKITISASGH